MIKRDLFPAPIKSQIAVVLTSVSLTAFTLAYTTRRAKGMTHEWSYKNPNSSYRGKIQ